jgi:hypothetical protein
MAGAGGAGDGGAAARAAQRLGGQQRGRPNAAAGGRVHGGRRACRGGCRGSRTGGSIGTCRCRRRRRSRRESVAVDAGRATHAVGDADAGDGPADASCRPSSDNVAARTRPLTTLGLWGMGHGAWALAGCRCSMPRSRLWRRCTSRCTSSRSRWRAPPRRSTSRTSSCTRTRCSLTTCHRHWAASIAPRAAAAAAAGHGGVVGERGLAELRVGAGGARRRHAARGTRARGAWLTAPRCARMHTYTPGRPAGRRTHGPGLRQVIGWPLRR